jgi:hypothetical protein
VKDYKKTKGWLVQAVGGPANGTWMRLAEPFPPRVYFPIEGQPLYRARYELRQATLRGGEPRTTAGKSPQPYMQYVYASPLHDVLP